MAKVADVVERKVVRYVTNELTRKLEYIRWRCCSRRSSKTRFFCSAVGLSYSEKGHEVCFAGGFSKRDWNMMSDRKL